jgi:hypothetical protein
MRIRTLPAPAQLSDSDKKRQYHYEVEFIFGTSEVRIIDLRKNLHQDVPIDEPATEENYLQEFEHICAAMLEAAVANENDTILCTTFPEGARRVEDAKYLSGLFGQGG